MSQFTTSTSKTLIDMHQLIPHSTLDKLLFGQQHVLTQTFFVRRLGQCHTVVLSNLPHVQFLNKLAERDHGGSNSHVEGEYECYLQCSWDYYFGREKNSPEQRSERAKQFAKLFSDIRTNNSIQEPIVLCRRPDGEIVIVDGNHRASAALVLGLDIPARFVDLPEQLRDVITVPDEFYGTMRLEQPYQSICHKGVVYVPGRRRDIIERFRFIAPSDIEGQSVLDLGCNVGMNCQLAAERGAREVLGIEGSPSIASAAVRLNAYFALPCSFVAHDLNQPLEGFGKFDTVFCFSVFEHVKNKAALVETIMNSVSKVLYFEGHAGSKLEDYAVLLNSDNFREIALLGHMMDGVHTDRASRPLFRCVVARAGANELPAASRSLADRIANWIPAWVSTWRGSSYSPVEDAIVTSIQSSIPEEDRFILVDENQFRAMVNRQDTALPFCEHQGEYWGLPVDDSAAIAEFNRLKHAGVRFIAFTAPSFWLLDHYTRFAEYLRSNFACALNTELLIVFDLLNISGADLARRDKEESS